MNRVRAFAVITVLALLMLLLTACGRSEFGVTTNTEKRMVITAENAEKDASFISGSLEVADGERIVITSDLTKGMIRLEIFEAPEGQSIDELPALDGEAIITANLERTDGASGAVPAGSYFLRAACLEKASGAVQIEVRPAA